MMLRGLPVDRQSHTLRRALGADRARRARQFLSESVVMALIAGAAGVLLAGWALAAMLAIWPGVPRVNEIGIDPWVLGFALVVSLVTGLAFGLVPALRGGPPAWRRCYATKAAPRRARAGAYTPALPRTQRVVGPHALSRPAVSLSWVRRSHARAPTGPGCRTSHVANLSHGGTLT
jgi:hypothetical protein